MNRRYYKLHDMDPERPDRWYLKGPVAADGSEIDPRIFTYGEYVNLDATISIPVRVAGDRMDFTLADFGMPVLLAPIAEALSARAPDDIQLIPAKVSGVTDPYMIVNVLSVVKCVDEKRSHVSFWTEAHGLPHMVGQYMAIRDLHIDPTLVGDHQIFRVHGMKPVIIVSEAVRELLLFAKGAYFEPV